MKPTIEELENIKRQREQEKKRKELAVSLNLCPECGAKLKTEYSEKSLFSIFGNSWDYRIICSVDISHYEDRHRNLRCSKTFC